MPKITVALAAVLAAGALVASGCAPTSAGPLQPAAARGPDEPGPPDGFDARGRSVQPPDPLPVVRVAGTVATGLKTPWGLGFLPDGSALVAERDTALVKHVTAAGQVTVAGTVPGVVAGGEGGLCGLAVSPSFATDHLVYVFHTAAQDNRIVRMTYTGGRLGAPQVVLAGIPKAKNHNGGRLAFGPDKMLYATTGDALDKDLPQDRRSLAGKILRMTPDGKPAPGNPSATSVAYTLGHRDVQGIAFDSAGRPWAAEFGETSWDELNLLRRGGNYGRPEVEGKVRERAYLDPAAQWAVADASPSGLAIVDDVAYMAALRGEQLWQIPLEGNRVGNPGGELKGTYGRLRTVEKAPDGSLWLTTSNTDTYGTPRPGDDRILRVVLAPGS